MRTLFQVALIASGGMMLVACAADSHSSLPDFLRVQASDAASLELPPDVKRMVREKLDAVFVATSYPRQVQVSPPHRDVRGQGWTACVRAEVTSATGHPLGAQTYRITISDGVILDRRRVGDEDNCASETYEPI